MAVASNPAPSHRRLFSRLTATAVVGGFIASLMANLWIEVPDAASLPGIALGSQTILVVERAVVLFAAWLLWLVVLAQALRGRLPVEISGRGVRYADASAAHETAAAVAAILHKLHVDAADLHERTLRMETAKGDDDDPSTVG